MTSPDTMNIGHLPVSCPSTRKQWLAECSRYFDSFRTLRENGFIPFAHLRYVRAEDSTPLGCVVVFENKEGELYAGASFVGSRDYYRFSKVEARARAIRDNVRMATVYPTHHLTYNPDKPHPWLMHFPPSCRSTLHEMIVMLLRRRSELHHTPVE